jgi:hypothetical protein
LFYCSDNVLDVLHPSRFGIAIFSHCIEIFHLDSAQQPFDKIAAKAEESVTTPSWQNNARMV